MVVRRVGRRREDRTSGESGHWESRDGPGRFESSGAPMGASLGSPPLARVSIPERLARNEQKRGMAGIASYTIEAIANSARGRSRRLDRIAETARAAVTEPVRIKG